MADSTEKIILAGLLKHDNYSSAALPFLKSDYFHDENERLIYDTIHDYQQQYKIMPNETALIYEVLHGKQFSGDRTELLKSMVHHIVNIEVKPEQTTWLLETTEHFCQQRAMYNVIMTAVNIYEGDETKIPETAIPDLMREAVNISFDATIGHDWLNDAEARYKFYTDKVATIPFDIDILNKITDCGVQRKTLNILLAGVNAGKTGMLCHFAAAYAKAGYNVLYISMEMREEMISKRLDANILGIPLDEFSDITHDRFMTKMETVKRKGMGQLIVKEYPTGSAHSGHFNHLVKELYQKRKIKLDVIVVDYIGICASAKAPHGANSYTAQKCISEELRAIAMEHDVALWTAMQVNRGGIQSTDVEMTDVADSMGPVQTADFIMAVMRTEELDESNRILCKQIKSRYANKSDLLRFTIGVDQQLQRYYDIEDSQYAVKPVVKEEPNAAQLGSFGRAKNNAKRLLGLKTT